ncbi:MAG: carboxypeptidase regulatory-like domain-containing protein, partial [Gemmatimonadaceae bacterium]
MQHLDEGTIHAWLEGALSPNEAARAESHVAECAVCASALAEARGMIAAASRVLAALDDVPALRTAPLPVTGLRRGWWRRAGMGYAAAATLLLAAGTTLVLRSAGNDVSLRDDLRPAATSVPLESLRDSAAAQEQARERASATRSAAAALEDSSRPAKRSRRKGESEDLSTDRVVPLPGAMPRPAAPVAPPPAVRQRDEKAEAPAAQAAGDPLTKVVTTNIQGRVINAATGVPIAHAAVTLDSSRQAALTDSAGRFALRDLPLGTYMVNVRAIGYVALQHEVEVAGADSVTLGFAMRASELRLSEVVVTGAAAAMPRGAAREGAVQGRRDSASAVDRREFAARVASPSEENKAGACFVLRAGTDSLAVSPAWTASLPRRVLLGAAPSDLKEREAARPNRAHTLEGTGRAESWRFVGDSLELVWTDGPRRFTMRAAHNESGYAGTLVG